MPESIHTKDESKRESAFAFIFGVNWLWHCGVKALFGIPIELTAPIIFGKMHFLLISENEFTHEIKRDGITSFMDFMWWHIMYTWDGMEHRPTCHNDNVQRMRRFVFKKRTQIWEKSTALHYLIYKPMQTLFFLHRRTMMYKNCTFV